MSFNNIHVAKFCVKLYFPSGCLFSLQSPFIHIYAVNTIYITTFSPQIFSPLIDIKVMWKITVITPSSSTLYSKVT